MSDSIKTEIQEIKQIITHYSERKTKMDLNLTADEVLKPKGDGKVSAEQLDPLKSSLVDSDGKV